MAEAAIVGIAEEIIANLVPRSIEKVGNLWGVKRELEVLKDTVSTLWAVLEDAEEKYDQSLQIQVWLEKLKDVFYDARDVLEEFNIEATRQELSGHNEMFKEVRTFFSSSNQLAFKLKMSSKVRALREQIEAIKADRRFHLDERNSPVDREWRKREERHSFRCEEDIIAGREDDMRGLMKFLLDSYMPENISILPIVGMGGVGKKTLARKVYNNAQVGLYFDLKMWVRVSVDFDVDKIVKNIIVCAMKKERTTVAMGQLQSELKAQIDGKRYLLVLADLCSVEQQTWLSLKTLLAGGARGSKILITTRNHLVAEITSTSPPFFLEGLSDDVSFYLLMRMACPEKEHVQDPDIEAIGKEIVPTCRGIPLLVRTVGNLLFFKKTKTEWQHFKDDLREVFFRQGDTKSILKLSYNHLPSHLRQCFAFCSLFPQDYEIKKQALVNLWVAGGFIQPSGRIQDLEDIAHGYFMDLLLSNFFEDFEEDNGTCKMHDLMHDLAYSVAGTECWAARDDPGSIHERTRHISHDSISNLVGGLLISRLKASSLKTFLFVPAYREMEQRKPTSEADLRQLIQSYKRLRILDLHAAIVKKVPITICKLKHLTYLDLSHNNELKRLPNSITRLQNLQTLNLQGCFALEELPRDIRKLINLRNLDIDYCYSLNYVPHGLGQLTCLHRLTRFILPQGKDLAKNYCGLEGLKGLNNIRGSLSIENLGHSRDALVESGAANLIEKQHLASLILKWSYLDNDDAVNGDTDEALLNGLRPHSNLQKLTIHGYKGENFPRWIINNLEYSLPNLVELRLLRCGKCKHVPQLGRLPHLKSLEIWRLTELEYIESDHSSTSELEYIESDHSPTSTALFRSLSRLDIQYCENLKSMPLAPRLEDLILRKVNRELIKLIFGLNVLKSLDISQMEFLECLPKDFLQSLTSLERLGISECPRLTSLSGMQHLPRLRRLSFSNCKELDISKDENGNISDLQGLKSLGSVYIHELPKLASLPQWLLRVSNLEHLSIKKCLKLKVLPEQIEALQSLQRLDIIRCPLLTSLPEGMQRLTSLNYLKIAGCPNLEEVCERDGGEDWYKIAHIPYITHQLEYYERHL
ncbi:putative disease resistance protein RGA3 [Syzygium oleosum]|uniref:putative disease resistance protein RGA3 n=1 Tax=Syzygium oleosum TaxID=219896 RepID=UPI0024B9EB1F|nr:putative disease resistance protein RGA3 [Syzygium oleosum]